MNQADTIATVNAMDCPAAAQAEGPVYQVWEDGEITLQKAGSLLWRRNLRCIEMGNESKALPCDALANKYNNHSFVFLDSHEAAAQARKLILERE